VIPEIDSKLEISVFSTSYDGCGGKIRLTDDGFFVYEILSDGILSLIIDKGEFAVYKLTKQNIDTNHALKNILKKTGNHLKSLGLKDSHAKTEQYVCSIKKSCTISDFSTPKLSLKKIGYLKKPFTKKDMIGNHFSISIHDASNFEKFDDFNKILNFFGYQRFGSKRPVTHLIGQAIVQRNFELAVSLLVSFTSEYDSKENTTLRKKLSHKSNYSIMESAVPPQMDLEKIVIREMIHHDDALKSLRALPVFLKIFFKA